MNSPTERQIARICSQLFSPELFASIPGNNLEGVYVVKSWTKLYAYSCSMSPIGKSEAVPDQFRNSIGMIKWR